MDSLSIYLQNIERVLGAGRPAERQSALQSLLQSFEGLRAARDARLADAGAPDLILMRGAALVGHVVVADPGANLAKVEREPRMQRCLATLPNLILTDYIEFRWYVVGKVWMTARLGDLQGSQVKRQREGFNAVAHLLEGFIAQPHPAVRTTGELAQRMGSVAREIRDLIIQNLTSEAPGRDLLAHMTAFQQTLLPELTVYQFADMYARAIPYVLLMARLRHTGQGRSQPFRRRDVYWDVPPTSPLVRDLFEKILGGDLDERVAWMVDVLVEWLAQADIDALLRDLNLFRRQEDPVTRFYALFLAEYDQNMRSDRDAHNTPEAQALYVVRSVDYLLKRRFKRGLGLAAPDTLLVDLAAGTGTFLYFAVQQIHDTLRQQRQLGAWEDYVLDELLPRLVGYESNLAAYVVAQLKLGLQLQRSGYRFASSSRLGFYLADALTLHEAERKPASKSSFAGLLEREITQAAALQTEQSLVAVMGSLLHAEADTRTRFIQLGQQYIERAGGGLLALVTGSAYLTQPAYQALRESLLAGFNELYILNLQGVPSDEAELDGPNDITICLFVREHTKDTTPGMVNVPARVYYAETRGQRQALYDYLYANDPATIHWSEIQPYKPRYLLIPQDTELRDEYEYGRAITEIMPVYAPAERGHFVIGFDREGAEQRVKDMRSHQVSDGHLRERYQIRDTQEWQLAATRDSLRQDEHWQERVLPCLYRPFDRRYGYHNPPESEAPPATGLDRVPTQDNLCLNIVNDVPGDEWRHVLVSDLVTPVSCLDPQATAWTFPLYRYPEAADPGDSSPFAPGKNGRRPNLKPEFVMMLAARLGMTFVSDGRGDGKRTFGPEDIFAYAYAICHATSYRRRYAEFLRSDFPYLPLTGDRKLFRALAREGRKLINLHLMRKSGLWQLVTGFSGMGSSVIEDGYPRFTEITGERRVYINDFKYFEGVPRAAWTFQIGGYRVLESWLTERRGRSLSFEDTLYYQRVVVAIQETMRVMQIIDNLIPGWPLV